MIQLKCTLKVHRCKDKKDIFKKRGKNMSKSKDLSSILPPSTYEFELKEKGKITKKEYSGTFKGKIANTQDRVRADIIRADCNGGMDDYLDASVLMINKMYAYLKVVIVDAPSWWKEAGDGYRLIDSNIIAAVYAEQQEKEKEYIKMVWGSDEDEENENEGEKE